MKKILNYFTNGEWVLWLSSLAILIICNFAFGVSDVLSLVSSLIGVTSLIFCAKGHPFGQILMIIFGILYGIISYRFAYYGEMITYVGMTAPMALISLISWIRNPYEKGSSEVAVAKLTRVDAVLLPVLTAGVTAIFYFILRYLGTANLIPSTFSVSTSFAAAYLTFRRSPYYAAVYALNDIVLIVLWTLASFSDISYVSVTVCFLLFLVNDLYGFISWKRMQKRQTKKL